MNLFKYINLFILRDIIQYIYINFLLKGTLTQHIFRLSLSIIGSQKPVRASEYGCQLLTRLVFEFETVSTVWSSSRGVGLDLLRDRRHISLSLAESGLVGYRAQLGEETPMGLKFFLLRFNLKKTEH